MNKRPEKAWAGQCRLTPAAKAAFIAAVREEASLAEAARSAGFSLHTFYRARKSDPDFNAAWEEAVAATAVPRIIAPGNRRQLQRRKIRLLRFTTERQEIFLAHFAGTCNGAESAAVAGVCEATIYRHRVKDGAFAAAFQLALEQGYVRLEAESLYQRLEAQKSMRRKRLPTGEVTAEFERVMKLLTRWDRRGGTVGPRQVAPGRRQTMTFDEAIEALHKRLQALDIPIQRLPPPAPPPEEPEA